jgi:hypothetical protein
VSRARVRVGVKVRIRAVIGHTTWQGEEKRREEKRREEQKSEETRRED